MDDIVQILAACEYLPYKMYQVIPLYSHVLHIRYYLRITESVDSNRRQCEKGLFNYTTSYSYPRITQKGHHIQIQLTLHIVESDSTTMAALGPDLSPALLVAELSPARPALSPARREPFPQVARARF